MKKLLLLPFCLFWSVFCFSQDWFPVAFNSDVTIYVDRSSIERIGSRIYCWHKFVYKDEASRQKHANEYYETMSDKKWLKYDHALTYDVYDGRKSQILSSIYYDINGNVLESEDNNESNSNYTRLVPGTIGMSAFDELNKQHVFEINGEEFKVYMEDVINFIVKNPDAIYFGNTEWVQYVSDYIQGRINEM